MKKLLALLLLLPLTVPGLALAQGYPSKPVRIIVPFPAGGTTDLVARQIQPRFAEYLGAQIVIENRGGAGGSIGAAEVARSAPDGYTLLMVFDTHAINHHLYPQAPDPFKTLEHLCLMVSSPSTLVGTMNFTPASLRDAVARAKAEQGKVTYGSVGTGSSNHLGALLLEQHGGIRMTHIPYKGGGPLIQALLGNQIDVAFVSSPLILPHIKSGKVKPLAVGGRQRLAQLPDVPTLAETFPGFELVSWFGLLAPAGVPHEISGRIQREMVKTLNEPGVKQKLIDGGFDVVASAPEEFLRWVRNESDKLGKVIRDNNLKVE